MKLISVSVSHQPCVKEHQITRLEIDDVLSGEGAAILGSAEETSVRSDIRSF